MGVTTHSNNLVQKHKGNAKTMLELGSQNTYFDCEPMGVAKDYYTKQGFEHYSLDANGEYDSEMVDLATVLNLEPCDIVTDFGTSEHVSNYYNCWLNKHNGCNIGGLIISENPKVNNWHGHGFHYLTKEFYSELCKVAGYELIQVGEHAAMGNVTDGWNVYGVLRKVSDVFPSESDFSALPFESVMVRNTAGGGNYTTEVTNIEDLTGNNAMGFASKVVAVATETPAKPKGKRGRPSKK